MAKRLAAVAWWIGSVLGGIVFLVALYILAAGTNDAGFFAAMWMIGAAICILPCWSVAFIFGGSFWKPPR